MTEAVPRDTRQVISASAGSNYSFRTSYHAWTLINQHLPNPDRVLQKRGAAIEIYRELLSDGHLTACLESRESVTMSYDWIVKRNGAPARLFASVENWFFNLLERKNCVDDLSRDDLTSNLLDVVYWGYQPAELSWDVVKGHWVPVLIQPKPPEWFHYYVNERGVPELRFLSADNPIDGEPPPDPYTLICPRVKATYDNPYGRGVAGRCFWPIVFKRAGMEFWLNFMERFGTPWVKGTITGAATSADLQEFTTQLKALVQDAVIAVAGTREVEILEAKNSQKSADGFEQLCGFMDSQMSKTILGHTLTTDASSYGSYAATKGAMTVRSDFIKRDVRMMTSIYNDIVNLVCLRNGYGDVPRPKVMPYHGEDVDSERATRDEALTRSGVVFSKSYFIKTYHLEEDDIERVDTAAMRQSSAPDGKKEPTTLNMEKEDKKIKEGDE